MTALLTGAGGLVLGLTLMVWALRERSKRHRAQLFANQLEIENKKLDLLARQNEVAAKKAGDELKRIKNHLGELRRKLYATRIQLAQSDDPKAVKKWLDQELDSEEL